MSKRIHVAVSSVGILAAMVGLTACGGSATGSSAGASGSGAASSGTAGPGGGNNPFASTAVQACLKAAGIAVPTGGAGGARPSGTGARPSGARPSGAVPSGGTRPSGAPTGGGFPGGAANSTQSAKIQAALKACGLTLSAGPAQPSASATG